MKFCVIVCCFLFLITTAFAAEDSNSTTAKPLNVKVAEKGLYPKKVSLTKKNVMRTSLKKIADITEKFKDLPADDLAFIKELDKQFKLHGGRVKIKVEHKNVSTDTKTSKRTVDGELGYGYAHNGYHYSPPKYMFYPYSQHNIESKAPNYFSMGDDKTQVSIQPSYSYELKSQSYITHHEPQIDVPKSKLQQQQQQQIDNFHHQHHHAVQQPQYEEPVIVLRIPGPAKYATHLQMLLQHYLEIRAAQYLRILEETEQRQSQQQQQQHHHQLQQLEYDQGNNANAEDHLEQLQGPVTEPQVSIAEQQVPITEQHVSITQPHVPVTEQHDYQKQVEYAHQIAATPQTIQYPEIDNVYHRYKHRHPEPIQQPFKDTQIYYTPQHNEEEAEVPQSQQYENPTHYQQPVPHHQSHYTQPEQPQLEYQQQAQEQPQFYYTHQQQYAQSAGPPANTYQHVYLITMMPQGQENYEEKQQPIYTQDQAVKNEHALSLPIAENNPRPSHTKVVFTNKNELPTQDYQMYQLPSIKPNERHVATSIPNYHQDFQQQQQNVPVKQDPQETSLSYQQDFNAAEPDKMKAVAITRTPFNYHAHNVKARARGRTAQTRRITRAKKSDNGLHKIREFVRENLGAEMGTAVEFRTTQVIAA